MTTDGHLVFEKDLDLMVLESGTTSPVTLVTDFDSETDIVLVRGRVAAAWVGENGISAAPLVSWSKASGVKPVTTSAMPNALYPNTATDDFAYAAPADGPLSRNVFATKAGQGAGTKVVAALDTGVVDATCKATIGWADTSLVIAGCVGGAAAKVATYALDGTGVLHTILTGSAPGMWLDHAHTHAIVQTASASSIRPIAGGTNVSLDGKIIRALFSDDDTKVVYLDATGKMKRASTSAPASPVILANDVSALLAISRDARYAAFSTTGNPNDGESDVIVVDATDPTHPQTLAESNGAFLGFSDDGHGAAFIGAEADLVRPLYVVTFPNVPTKLSDVSHAATFDGTAAYWQEQSEPKTTNVLKGAKLSAPSTVTEVATGIDGLTSFAVVAGQRLYVANKFGLWSYPRIAP